MKSLNLARPHILLIVGSPGAGKSFFARQFSETFGAPVVCQNRIRFELFDSPSFSNDESDLVNRLMMYQVEELLKSGRTFMLDGGGNARSDRVRLGQIARKAGYDVGIIWVQADLPTCRLRSLKRNPDKSDDDKYSPSISEEVFDAMSRRFTEPTRENFVAISGKHTYNTQAKMVLRKLVVAREAEADEAHRQGIAQSKHTTQRPDAYRRGVVIR